MAPTLRDAVGRGMSAARRRPRRADRLPGRRGACRTTASRMRSGSRSPATWSRRSSPTSAVDWSNSLFLSCRFRAWRQGEFNEYVYNFFKSLSVERMRRTEAEAKRKLDPPTEIEPDIEIDGYVMQRRCPHRNADLSVFGEVECQDGRDVLRVHAARLAVRPRIGRLPDLGEPPAARAPGRASVVTVAPARSRWCPRRPTDGRTSPSCSAPKVIRRGAGASGSGCATPSGVMARTASNKEALRLQVTAATVDGERPTRRARLRRR